MRAGRETGLDPMEVTENDEKAPLRWALHTTAIAIPALILALVLLWPSEPLPQALWQVPEFSLLDQDAQPFSDQQMRGHVWVAGFVYTNCPDVCPLITQRMATLRDSLRTEGEFGSAVRFASFTVDPERDTPAVLRAYASSFGVDDAQEWRFLTGEAAAVLALINEGFHLNAARAEQTMAALDSGSVKSAVSHSHGGEEHVHETPQPVDGYMVGHSDRLVLIDHEGVVRGTYVSSDADALAQLRRDLRVLVRRL